MVHNKQEKAVGIDLWIRSGTLQTGKRLLAKSEITTIIRRL
jgi:hypothetical protein